MRTESRSRPWLVPLAGLRRVPGSRRQVEIAAPIPELSITDSGVPEGVPVSFDGAIESFAGGVTVKGLVRAPFEGTCRRCLGVAKGHLVAVVDEVCTEDPRAGNDYAVGTDYIDLEPMVHDACILELPLAPLCQEQCQGLCPYCGIDRNQETCSCVEPDISTS